MTKGWLLLILVLALLIVFGVAVGSATASPGTLYVKPSASGSGNCSNWANACILQTALGMASDGDEIWVAEGIHKPGASRTDTFQLVNGVEIYGGFQGTETGRDQRDWTVHETILSGDINSVADNTDNSYHVVTSSSVTETCVLDGFTISGGYATGAFPDYSGAGMYNSNSSPTLANLTFSDNSATSGGGMGNHSSSPTLTDVDFNGNSARGGSGGGMSNWDNSSPTMADITFSDNSARYGGGGLFNWESNNPALINVVFSGNSAELGGGMYNHQSSPTLTNVIFSGNSASEKGGGMANYWSSSPTLTNVTFSGNSADSWGGGGMLNEFSATPTLTNCVFWGNTGTPGAQIYNDTSTPTISYSLVQDCGGSNGSWDTSLGTDGGGNIDADPQFVDAPNGDLRLRLTSAAIDAGDNTSLPADLLDLDGDGDKMELLPYDLGRYFRRVDIPDVPDSGAGLAPIVDMGAYEAQYPAGYLPLVLKN